MLEILTHALTHSLSLSLSLTLSLSLSLTHTHARTLRSLCFSMTLLLTSVVIVRHVGNALSYVGNALSYEGNALTYDALVRALIYKCGQARR
jgi:hypothetical protein